MDKRDIYQRYTQSLMEVIKDPTSGIILHKIGKEVQIGFVNSSDKWRGVDGHDTILVDYRVSISHWVTGFQPEELDNVLEKWNEVKWIRLFNKKYIKGYDPLMEH